MDVERVDRGLHEVMRGLQKITVCMQTVNRVLRKVIIGLLRVTVYV